MGAEESSGVLPKGTAAGMGAGGAAVGTAILPGMGTAAGGLGGYMFGKMLEGTPYYMPDNYNYNWEDTNAAANMQNQTREQQQALGEMLRLQAQGKGPSVAQNQLRQAQAQNMAQMSSQAASAQGGAMNRMMAQNAAINAGANAGQQAAGQSATLRAQEQLGAYGQMGQLYGQQRSQDLGEQDMQQKRQLGVADDYIETEKNRAAAQASANSNDTNVLGVASSLIPKFSDIRVKKDISSPSDDEMSALLEHLVPRKYRYQEEPESAPIRIGIMAQDIERAPGGAAIVGKDRDGMRYIKGDNALGTVLAALGEIHSRIRELEGRPRHGR